MKLYEISDEIRQLLSGTDDLGGILTDESLEKLSRLEGDLNDKVEAICCVIAEEEASAAARKAQVDRLNAGIKASDARVKRMKEYVLGTMIGIGIKESGGDLWNVKVQRSGPSVVCTVEADQLPQELQRVKTTIEPDKKKVLEHYKATGQVHHGFTVHEGRHIVIR